MSIGEGLRRMFGTREPETQGCVACGSLELETLAAETYRCRACGHEGGDGYPAYRAGLARAKLASMSADGLREHALARFEDLRLAVIGLAGDTGAGAAAMAQAGDAISFSAHVTGLPIPGGGAAQDIAEERAQQQLRFEALVHDVKATRALVEALDSRGAPMVTVLVALARVDGRKVPLPHDMLAYCLEAKARVEGWTPA